MVRNGRYARETAQFRVQTPEPFPVQPVHIKSLNLSVLTKLADFLLRAPVEPMGYKKMINLPD
jgi:hypothetical protein